MVCMWLWQAHDRRWALRIQTTENIHHQTQECHILSIITWIYQIFIQDHDNMMCYYITFEEFFGTKPVRRKNVFKWSTRFYNIREATKRLTAIPKYHFISHLKTLIRNSYETLYRNNERWSFYRNPATKQKSERRKQEIKEIGDAKQTNTLACIAKLVRDVLTRRCLGVRSILLNISIV